MDMNDVRRALFRAYANEAKRHYGLEGCKSSEAYCELLYPTWWECGGDESAFLQPYGVMVYSYALGPNRQHYFTRGETDRQIESNRWESPDFFAKAVEVINQWDAQAAVRDAEDA